MKMFLSSFDKGLPRSLSTSLRVSSLAGVFLGGTLRVGSRSESGTGMETLAAVRGDTRFTRSNPL